jgi:dTMP kinase
MMERAGRLVALEGAEGTGKTTQVRRLVERLSVKGVDCVAVREPGGTPVGDSIRTLLLDPEQAIGPRAEALLFMASRAELCERELRPALDRGALVVMDRFFLSTYAYQVGGRGLPEAEIRVANTLATGGLVPDLTILLRLPLEEALARAAARSAPDRMEGSGREFHERVAAAFERFASQDWMRAHPECGPVVSVDASGSRDAVSSRIWRTLEEAIPGIFSAVVESK